MKVTIWYEYLPQYEQKYFAKVKLNGNYICRCGNSWEQARLDMIAKLKELEEQASYNAQIPPSEEVELNIPEAEEVAHVS